MILSTGDGDGGVGWEVVEETLKCMQLGLMHDAHTEADGRDAQSNASEVCLCVIVFVSLFWRFCALENVGMSL